MPKARLPMRKLRDVLRLTSAGLSSRQVAASVGIGAATVGEYLGRARRANIVWPLPGDLSDEALEARLFPQPLAIPQDQRPLPDWPAVHRELRRKGVTLQLASQPSPVIVTATETVAEISYAGDEGGILCHIRPTGGSNMLVASLTHLRVPRTLPFSAAALDYQKHRAKKLKKQIGWR